ncbi:hypothetical protein [Pseudomonas sputi]|uniref:hypothetical protein n=1 Tax=Pseudomonas sputi TaxID=2892325 RepID=UPI001F422FBC|nr:hypothetical protein [Pseudomonas sputi]
MDYYATVAPTPSPSVFYASQAPLGHIPPMENTYAGATRFVSTDFPGLNVGKPGNRVSESLPKSAPLTDATPLVTMSPEASTPRAPVHERHIPARDLEINKIAEDRIKLLAIKYANDSISAEMIARLEILNSRLIERSPRVTVEQINFLEGSIGSIKTIEQSRLDRAKRLGLPT